MPIQSTTPRAIRIGLTLALAGCGSVLEVDRPDIIDPGELTSPAAATAYYNGAVGDVAFAQGTASGLMLISSLFSDEYRFGGTPPEVREQDLGDIQVQNSFAQVPYLYLHRARRATERAAQQIGQLGRGTADGRIGELYALSALTIIWIGETYCSGAPFSDNEGNDIRYGTSQSTTQTFDLALAKLHSASATTGSDASVANLIAVLRGRALVNKGDYANAALAVAGVPTDFVYNTLFSSADDRTKNNMKAFEYDFDYLSVSDREGINGLDFVSARDPRVPTTQLFGPVSRFDGRTPMYQFPKYSSDAPIVNASGVEARLIQSEAALEVGDVPGWLAQLNAARAQFNSTFSGPDPLVSLTDPGSGTARVDLMFRERAFHLFGTAHRLGDLRRLVRQYGRVSTSVFPTGPYHKDSLIRGDQVAIRVPFSENNNPNYHDTDCDPKKP